MQYFSNKKYGGFSKKKLIFGHICTILTSIKSQFFDYLKFEIQYFSNAVTSILKWTFKKSRSCESYDSISPTRGPKTKKTFFLAVFWP